MFLSKLSKILRFFLILPFFLISCSGNNQKEIIHDPKLRVKKNLEEGRGFRLMDSIGKQKTTNYEFASSNELWRASLDTLDFMPLVSVNYSGGIIVTDWYSNDHNHKESIKISVRFLTNEIRSDAIEVKIFKKICLNISNCKISETSEELKTEIKRKILKTAKIYESEKKDKNFKPYKSTKLKD